MDVTLERAASVPRNFDGADERFKAKQTHTIQGLMESGVPFIVKLLKPKERWGTLDTMQSQREGRKIWEDIITAVGNEKWSAMGGSIFLADFDAPRYWELRQGDGVFRPHQGEFNHRHSDKMYGVADFYTSETLKFNDVFQHLQHLGYQLPI